MFINKLMDTAYLNIDLFLVFNFFSREIYFGFRSIPFFRLTVFN